MPAMSPIVQMLWGERRRLGTFGISVDHDRCGLARARGGADDGAVGAVRATGWRATALRFNNCGEQQIDHTRAELSRARGARRPSAVGQRSDPRSDRPAGAACWPPSPIPSREILFRGKMMLMLLLRLAAAQRRGQR